MRVITRAEWERKKKHGYASIMRDCNRAVLTADTETGATILEAVEVEGMRPVTQRRNP